jgi:aminopeptidase N
MIRFLSIVSVILSLFVGSSLNGQVRALHGCHHAHNKKGKMKPLTEHERVLLNQSIARSDTFDIVSYTISIDVTDYAGQSIQAETTVEVQPLMANQEHVRFDLFQLQVDSVKDETGNLNYSYDGNFLDVQFAEVPAIGETQLITVYYQGNPYQDPTWGGFYFESNYIYSLGIGLTTIPPNFGRVWYPCFDSFVERATYTYHVKSAGVYAAHCQGSFLGELQLDGDTIIRSFAMEQPIPTHLSAIAVADYQDYNFIYSGANGDIPIRFTAKSQHMSAMQNVLQNVGSCVDALEYWYGPYAWQRVGYVLTTDGALEIATNIAYPQYMINEPLGPNNRLMAHELGHHWWGNIVTPHNHNDMWLKEGPAEYSAHLFTEWHYGVEDFVDQVKTNHLDVLKNAHIDDDGFYAMSPMPDEVIYGTHTYYKGASVMHNLRGYLGDVLFRDAMTGVQTDNVYEDVTPEQFRDVLELASGASLDDFFDDQIFSPGFSVFVTDSFQVAAAGNGFSVDVFIQQKLRECPQFYDNVPLDITFIADNYQRFEAQTLLSGQYSTKNFIVPFEPEIVVLNGHNRLNQARMDYEFVQMADETLYPVLPYVEFRVSKENVVDSSLIRVEHIWAAPDQMPLGDGIFEISDQHYFIVDGLWNEGDYFTGKVYYNGAVATDLDYELYNEGEQTAVLLYREDSSYPWELCPDFTLGGGSLTNGDGSFDIDPLRQGQYAFANGDISAGLDVAPLQPAAFVVYPNPAVDRVQVSGNYPSPETALFDVLSVNGKLVQRSAGLIHNGFTKEIDTSSLESGIFFLRVVSNKGDVIGLERFEISQR